MPVIVYPTIMAGKGVSGDVVRVLNEAILVFSRRGEGGASAGANVKNLDLTEFWKTKLRHSPTTGTGNGGPENLTGPYNHISEGILISASILSLSFGSYRSDD